MLHSIFRFLTDLSKNRGLIFQLTRWDFKSRYLGTYLGLLWAFIQPIVTIMIFWFVFEVGFKSAPVKEVPFVLWLITGMIPWFFFADSVQNASTAVADNKFLVKKIVFKVSTLPLIKIMTSLVVHLFFIGVIYALFAAYGIFPNLYSLQVFYYLFAAIILILGLSWITSSIIVFSKDVGQMVTMSLQFGFWLTPIFWSIQILPPKYQQIVKLNPIFYITEGYRDAFIHQVWFWERPWQSLCFWVITGLIFFTGALVFSQLKPHFADVI